MQSPARELAINGFDIEVQGHDLVPGDQEGDGFVGHLSL